MSYRNGFLIIGASLPRGAGQDLEDAVVGMTEAEAARFRAKMAELSAVLEDELNQLEEQNNKLLVRTSRRAQ